MTGKSENNRGGIRFPKDRIRVKICGLTRPDQAIACEALGVWAIGLVFYPPSPRHLSVEKAREIRTALSRNTTVVGVFVNETVEKMIEVAQYCGLDAVQLSGQETPETVDRLSAEGISGIKALFATTPPLLAQAGSYRSAAALLVECGGGKLPGGNAQTWDWSAARYLGNSIPRILAGGLTPDNVGRAVQDARPDAVDVSSGVESAPGRKDIERVRRFVIAAGSSLDKLKGR
jgi:phosphoribosylanthranilate isomerase